MPPSAPVYRVLCSTGGVRVIDYRCTSGPGDRPFTEMHSSQSFSYVYGGTFTCHCRGRRFELVPGSILVGHPGDEYTCEHEHHEGGDQCLSFQFAPGLLDEVLKAACPSSAVPPVSTLQVVCQLALSTTRHHGAIGLDELAWVVAARVGQSLGTARAASNRVSVRARTRLVSAALRIEEQAADGISLQQLAEGASMSPYHFLRQFAAAFGITPHQYLIRARLRRAARMLVEDDRPITDVALDAGFADLSNFTRTFSQAAGMAPSRFRSARHGSRNFLRQLRQP